MAGVLSKRPTSPKFRYNSRSLPFSSLLFPYPRLAAFSPRLSLKSYMSSLVQADGIVC